MTDIPGTEDTIGFVGLGHMGGGMAERLLAAGYWRIIAGLENRPG